MFVSRDVTYTFIFKTSKPIFTLATIRKKKKFILCTKSNRILFQSQVVTLIKKGEVGEYLVHVLYSIDFQTSINLFFFVQLVGTNGVLNVDSKLRLQLYSPPPRARKNPQTLEVFQWWAKYPWNRYASTLYVTVKGLKLPEHVSITNYSNMHRVVS